MNALRDPLRSVRTPWSGAAGSGLCGHGLVPAGLVLAGLLLATVACRPTATPTVPAPGVPTPSAVSTDPTATVATPVSADGAPTVTGGVARGYPPPAAAGRRQQLPLVLVGSAGAEATGAVKPGAGGSTAAVEPGADETTSIEPGATEPAAGVCPGIAASDGGLLVLDGQPFVFFGLNAQHFLEPSFPEAVASEQVVALAERGVNALRIWFFHDEDPERLARLLDLGREHGVRFVVVLGDHVHKDVDWFFGEEDKEDFQPHLQRTVERFRDRPEILMWEVINEPTCGAGRFDEDCLKVVRNWIVSTAGAIKAIDGCHLVSSGMIGAGNVESEQRHFRMVHRKDEIDVVSVHRRSTDRKDDELELAADEGMPVIYGEVYDVAFEDGCAPLGGGSEPERRAARIKEDFFDAREDGVDGYLMWDFSPGRVRRTNGEERDYCSKFGFALDDPLWGKLERSEEGVPAVPW